MGGNLIPEGVSSPEGVVQPAGTPEGEQFVSDRTLKQIGLAQLEELRKIRSVLEQAFNVTAIDGEDSWAL